MTSEESFISKSFCVRCKCGVVHFFGLEIGTNAKEYLKEKVGDISCSSCGIVLDIPNVRVI